jgi:hypothetical protein
MTTGEENKNGVVRWLPGQTAINGVFAGERYTINVYTGWLVSYTYALDVTSR